MSYVIGLTGGIGSGKSTVADLFAARGALLVDTDVIAHELTAPGGGAMAAIEAQFGAAVLAPNGALDRNAMRALAFTDTSVRQQLEAILHPRIHAESLARCAAATAPYVLLVVPLLVESLRHGVYREVLQRILVVDCDESVQIERVGKRSALSAEQVRAIMAAQASRAERNALADDLIRNNDGLAELLPQVERLHRRYLDLAIAENCT